MTYYETTVDIFGRETLIHVEYEHHNASYGKRSGGVPIEPDEPEHVEVIRVLVKTEKGFIPFPIDEYFEEMFSDDILSIFQS